MAVNETIQGVILEYNPVFTVMLIGEYGTQATFPATVTSGRETSSDLLVPAGAVVDQAIVRVAASAPNSTKISDIATVRAAAGDPLASSSDMIIDFGVMRNVSALEGPVSITHVAPWLGTSFGDTANQPEGGSTSVALQELQTERLLVTYDSAVTPVAVGDKRIVTTTPPADLELQVAGVRVWFRQGSVPAGFSEEVDITDAVQLAVSSGTTPVPVVLSSRIAGKLELTPVGAVKYLNTHVVLFDQGETTSIDVAEEGVVGIELPLPAESTQWTIHRVVGTVLAEDPGPERIDPAIGPSVLTAADLTLDPDRRIVVRLPADASTRFTRLAAVRIRLHAGASGIGVVGGLLDGTPTAPGVPIPGGEIVEVAVESIAAPAWVTLRFAKPVTLPAEASLWLSIAATRGTATLALRDVPADAEASGRMIDDEEVALVRRIAPNGVAKALSAPVGVRTDALALRLVGTAPDGRPIDLVDVGIGARASDGSVVDVASTTEPSDGPDRFVRALNDPASVDGLRVRATLTAPTRLTVGPVVVAYEQGVQP